MTELIAIPHGAVPHCYSPVAPPFPPAAIKRQLLVSLIVCSPSYASSFQHSHCLARRWRISWYFIKHSNRGKRNEREKPAGEVPLFSSSDNCLSASAFLGIGSQTSPKYRMSKLGFGKESH
jgi:hypothetical protein